ncbi:Cytochrome c-type biogenesis protein ccmE [Deinococcus proteolyticus MRP]|uniref:Cytochrome c-type biogenesis protein CcmE n=1 Tax=Deinococcus proteolyticus (strain ATCC 35074 / DSM 20540 / JCM 6276 / NBRC 101906 / NCIMB 13154 / VKM Ac-1939 / CCM 2703 / MRP) TaxID=693977 RepID=F0RMK0_DEIPM|nr:MULTISPECIES: cytochrome c maturation protein CcmE [Deinococcus]ADY26050.1 Cytochrome c-type biogenesis protein ccmE [Deinococcus proteolyticus MRP]MCY1702171.1 cytochrome c maturation protein CcmE [Deinococcus sp. SL84]
MTQPLNSPTPSASALPRARRRRRNPLPSILGGGALLTLAGVLAFGSLGQSLEYFKTPSEYQQAESQLQGRLLRLGGLVQNAKYDPQTLNLTFDLTDGSVTYPVHYTGAVSDMFKEGQGVIVRGRFGEAGGKADVFQATELIVKHSEEYRVPQNQADIDQLKVLLESGDSSKGAGQ